MTKLEELLYSLGIVLISYHDSQQYDNKKKLIDENSVSSLKELREKRMAYAKILLKDKDFQQKSDEIIKDSPDKYQGRRPLLDFIVHEILFLRTIQEKTASFKPTELAECKKQLNQLFTDLKTLLTTPKGKCNLIAYSKIKNDVSDTSASSSSEQVSSSAAPKVSLSGLISTDWFSAPGKASTSGQILCNSGDIINDELLSVFNIPLSFSGKKVIPFSDRDAQQIVEDLCNEHQQILLERELKLENAKLDMIHPLLNAQQEISDKLRQEIEEQKTLIATLQEKADSQAQKISELNIEIGELRQKESDLLHAPATRPLPSPLAALSNYLQHGMFSTRLNSIDHIPFSPSSFPTYGASQDES